MATTKKKISHDERP